MLSLSMKWNKSTRDLSIYCVLIIKKNKDNGYFLIILLSKELIILYLSKVYVKATDEIQNECNLKMVYHIYTTLTVTFTQEMKNILSYDIAIRWLFDLQFLKDK